MRALVTGASGFIGSTLIEELSSLGFEVDALMRSSSSDGNLRGLRYRRVEGDLRDEASLRRAVRDVDYVFHLAGLVAARRRSDFFELNEAGTERLARVVSEECPGLSRFVFVSSMAASGPAMAADAPRTEASPERPVSAYGESKLAAERALLRYRERFPISIVRPPMVYGPRDRNVFSIVQSVDRNLMPVLQGSGPDGQKHYSHIHVRDLCRGMVQSAVTPGLESGEVFFLTGDRSATYQEVLSAIADKLGRDPLRFRVPGAAITAMAVVLTGVGVITRRTFPLTWDRLGEMRPDYWVCSNAKARERLGFAPEYDLESGLGNAIDWYKRERWV